MLKTLVDATGQAPIILPPDFARFIVFLYQAGGTVIGPDGSVAIDSPETEQALDYYYGLYADGLAATPADVGAQWPGDAFAKDLGVIVFEGNWMFPFLATSAPDKQFLIAELPAGPAGKVTMGFTVSYSINANTKVPDSAWKLVNYLTGPEGMARWTDLGLAMPSRPALAEAWIAKYPERGHTSRAANTPDLGSSDRADKRSSKTPTRSLSRSSPGRQSPETRSRS